MMTPDTAATAPPTPVRRIVTGHDSTGKAVVVSDAPSPAVAVVETAHLAITQVWELSGVPARVDAWPEPEPGSPMPITPGPDGLNFRVLQFNPSPVDASVDGVTALAGMGSPDAHVENARHPAMHRTETVDFGIVLSGSMTLLLDEEDVLLSTGDVVIQRGTNHAWENRSDGPATMAFVVIDGRATS